MQPMKNNFLKRSIYEYLSIGIFKCLILKHQYVISEYIVSFIILEPFIRRFRLNETQILPIEQYPYILFFDIFFSATRKVTCLVLELIITSKVRDILQETKGNACYYAQVWNAQSVFTNNTPNCAMFFITVCKGVE